MQQLLTAYGSQFNEPGQKPAYVHQEFPKMLFHPDYHGETNKKAFVIVADEKEEKKYLAKKYLTKAPQPPSTDDDSEA